MIYIKTLPIYRPHLSLHWAPRVFPHINFLHYFFFLPRWEKKEKIFTTFLSTNNNKIFNQLCCSSSDYQKFRFPRCSVCQISQIFQVLRFLNFQNWTPAEPATVLSGCLLLVVQFCNVFCFARFARFPSFSNSFHNCTAIELRFTTIHLLLHQLSRSAIHLFTSPTDSSFCHWLLTQPEFTTEMTTAYTRPFKNEFAMISRTAIDYWNYTLLLC